MVLDPDTLYLGDNGRCLCGRCSGATAQYTGRDISGQKVEPVTESTILEFARMGFRVRCEGCGALAIIIKGNGVAIEAEVQKS
ncbi:MAG: hypothetical protein HY286_07000 [Planctomycetes bacterium]|nr:hypothetical protein [Planctomycetota bacterium]